MANAKFHSNTGAKPIKNVSKTRMEINGARLKLTVMAKCLNMLYVKQ